jgi:integrase
VTFTQEVADVLRAIQGAQLVNKAELGEIWQETGFVFTKPDGTPLDPARVTRAFAAVMRKAGLSGVRLHDLRHTHATLMLIAGIHPKVVSERLGHASIAITMDTYSHVLPSLQEDAADRFSQVVRDAR